MYADVCRRLAEEPAVEALVDGVRWDVPVRVLGGLHYLALSEGIDPWSSLHDVLVERADWLGRFVSEQEVKTNEVGRCFALLPAFLELGRAGGRPLDLVELGPSAGLNLLFDRYRYRYRAGEWGDARSAVLVAGEEQGDGVPADLLRTQIEISRRRGIDLHPVDVSTEEGVLLLSCFVWADQWHRLERLGRAIDVVRADPPELLRGDYVELLPELLAERDPEALTVVFQSASTQYLAAERYAEVRRSLEAAGAEAPLGWVSTQRFDEEEERRPGYPLELALWPEPGRAVVAQMGYHGEWLDWTG